MPDLQSYDLSETWKRVGGIFDFVSISDHIFLLLLFFVSDKLAGAFAG